MSDEAALLSAILAHPDEDTPRLMYADWLEEHGQPERAEFIRLQCMADLDDTSRGRVFELEQWYRSRWLAGLPQGESLSWEFRRGFPENLTIAAYPFLEQYESIVQIRWLRSLSLQYMNEEGVRGLVSRTWNPRWSELELEASVYRGYMAAGLSTPCIVDVANCPQVAQLQLLRFSLFELAAPGIHALASSPHLTNLRQLRLDSVTDLPALAALRARFGDRLVIG